MFRKVMARLNGVDWVIMSTVFLAVLGILAVQSGWHKTSGEAIKGETDIQYTVLLRNLKTLEPKLFVPGENLSITIRNHPRGKVKIVESQFNPKKLVVPMADGGYKLIDDPADTNGYDYLVTLKDHALVGEEGYVTEGIKVKIGLPIEVEGFNYRVNGVIVSVKDLNTPAAASAN
jgi:hypothetical protein